MTMIGFACADDEAVFITDSLAYNPNVRHLMPSTKFTNLPHLNAVVMGQGTSSFNTAVKSLFAGALESVQDYDDLVREAPDLLRQLRDDTAEDFDGVNGPRLDVLIAAVGYSPSEGKFVGHTFYNFEDFRPHRVEGLFLTPAPFDIQPHPAELDRLLRHRYIADVEAMLRERASGTETEEQWESARASARKLNETVQSLHDSWAEQPPLDPPTSIDDWITIALYTRRERALCDPQMRVMVGGDLIYGRIDQHTCYTRKVPLFDDTGEEFASMVAGSDHPVAQRAACSYCDSGKPANACCLPRFADEPCGCMRPGATFGECCYVPPEPAAV